MSTPIYPHDVRGLAWPILVRPEQSNILQQAANFYETRISQSYNPIWHFNLIYDYLKDNPNDIVSALSPYTDYQALEGFWLARGGIYGDFLIDCQKFNMPAEWYLQTTVTLSLITDGAYWYSPIQRNFGGFMEDITDLNQTVNTFKVYANGVLQTLTTQYTIAGPGLSIPGYSYAGLYVKWDQGSPIYHPTAPITATFNFYERVRFETDEQDFENFLSQLWTIGGSGAKNGSGLLELVTARPASS